MSKKKTLQSVMTPYIFASAVESYLRKKFPYGYCKTSVTITKSVRVLVIDEAFRPYSHNEYNKIELVLDALHEGFEKVLLNEFVSSISVYSDTELL